MASEPAIVFFHVGAFPRYLYATMESARFFNPNARIFLISDQQGTGVEALGAESRTPESIQHPKLPTLLDRYVHISGIKSDYERICLARWFYLEQLLRNEALDRVAFLDSDAMLFHRVADLFRFFPESANLGVSKGGGPAFTFVRHTIEPLLDLMLEKFLDRDFLDACRRRSEAAIAKGHLDNLNDMTFLALFTSRRDGRGVSYPNHLPIGHIDHSFFRSDDGLLSVPNRRHVSRKRIFWDDQDGVFIPSYRTADDGRKVPALLIHFQNGAKRRIRRFNRVGPDSWVPRALRLRYYNHLLN